MTLDDGTTDGESDSHAAVLRCVERVEESVRGLRVEPRSRVFDAQEHAFAFLLLGAHQQLPWTIVHGTHRVGCIPD